MSKMTGSKGAARPGWLVLALLAIVPLVAGGQLGADVPSDGLVASYSFTGNAEDESGNGNHGTVSGAVLTTDRFGESSRAYRFDGIDDFIVANADNLPVAERTISMWFLADRLDNRPGLMGYGGGSCGTSWWMGINNGSADGQYQMQGHCLVNQVRSGYGPEPVNRWYHWLMTTDPSGTRIYIDGVEYARNNVFVSNTDVAGKDIALGVPTDAAGVAPYVDANTGYFDGKLDEIVIYDRALESGEIADVFSGTLPAGYVLYYPFSGSAGDESGNMNDGFVIGATLTSDRFGVAASAYSFDGIDDYIVADADNLPAGERTVSLWFFADAMIGRPGLLGYGGGTCGTSWLMGINNGGADNRYLMHGHCGANSLLAGYAPEPVLEWVHLVMTTSSLGTKIFVNGELVGSNSIFVTNTSVAGRDLVFGSIPSPGGAAPYADANSGYFDGKLDDIVIYSRAVSSDEVKELFYDGDPSLVFLNGFESGDTSKWSQVAP